ncbi:DNA polymerase/3'-5' exonuclease PolX [Risungbinella massiliensis]|uniref:DNA polymerase/3'-5' exonuclease PolX n=1 Tax=Risungbinella massiliensis TaxID=1329796 RepID=UPI00069A98DE|nr:DNA polymerase/3'-5' exonuclease PolX [Risungbinella massiliensis]
MNNKQVAGILHTYGDYLEISGENAFRVGAYRKAARAIENSRQAVADLEDLTSLPGVGKGTATVIAEILSTGKLLALEELKEALPPELPKLLNVPGLGPKSIYTLHKELGVRNLQDLRDVAEGQKIRGLSGFGPKKEQKILEGLEQLHARPERILLHEADLVAYRLLSQIQDMQEVKRVQLAGSIRRRKETIKDIDFVLSTLDPITVAKQIVSLPEVQEVVNHGDTKVSIIVKVEEIVVSCDVRLVTEEQFASALHHFTGSKDHNVRVRQRAKQMGLKVSEYGVENTESGETITFSSEQEFFDHLHLPYIIPELREDRGEMEQGDKANLPDLIEQHDYCGDLHMHTLYSDGANSILEMALAAKERGYEYIAITDHSRSLQVASGLSIKELEEQWKEIEDVNRQLKGEGITVLKGTEMDILPDGTLDFPDEVLRELDIVIAAIHINFRQSEEVMTRRILNAMENPYVNIIAHPTGRKLLQRDSYPVNLEKLFQTAKETGTILELNANPHRLDLNDEQLKRMKEEYGLMTAINTDAHSIEGLGMLPYGIATARRGWLRKEDVLNTLTLTELKKLLGSKRAKMNK